jgi:hypothetical protein
MRSVWSGREDSTPQNRHDQSHKHHPPGSVREMRRLHVGVFARLRDAEQLGELDAEHWIAR